MAKKIGFSIIIPTYHEAKNIPVLIKKIAEQDFKDTPFEVILVDDDSRDGTTEIVNHLHETYPWLELFVRQSYLGPSWCQSVIKGIELANHPILIFMDADLSHPPETIPHMLRLLKQTDIDMVIGSRYMKGGCIDAHWPMYRNIISHLAKYAIKPLLPSAIKDPLSGFIAIKKIIHSMNGELWNPIGTKIGLEIMVKSNVKNIIEIPIFFKQRQFGKSKLMGMKVAFLYAKQIKQLWHYKLFGADRR